MRKNLWFGLLLVLTFGCVQGCVPDMRSSVTYVPPANPLPETSHEGGQAPAESVPHSPHSELALQSLEPAPNQPGPDTAMPVEVPEPAKPTVVPVKLVRGNPRLKKIALTFDDGPHAGFTEELIRILQQFKVPATFFMIGRNIDANPTLARAAFDAGFEIANHTYTHHRLLTLADYDVKVEIERGADAISKITGERPRFFRPPGGEYDQRTLDICKDLQMTMVLWTADAGDFTTPFGNPTADQITQKVMRYASPGGIVIMHDPMPPTLKALPGIITSLRALGYEFVTISQLAAEPNAITTGGPRIKASSKATVQSLSDQGRYPTTNHNASPEQRVKNEASPQGRADQGIDQGSQGEQVIKGQVGGTKGNSGPEGSGSKGHQEGGTKGNR